MTIAVDLHDTASLRALLVAELHGGAPLKYLARQHNMSLAVARSLLSDDDLRAILKRALCEGVNMLGAARQLGLNKAVALHLLGVTEASLVVHGTLADLVVAEFDKGVSPATVALKYCLSPDQVTTTLVALRPAAFAYRQLRGCTSVDALIAKAPGLDVDVIMEQAARVRVDRGQTFMPDEASEPRVMLRTDDRMLTVSTGQSALRDARRMMAALAHGRAWSEVVMP